MKDGRGWPKGKPRGGHAGYCKPPGSKGLKDKIISMYEDGYTHPQIAKALGCTRSNVYKLVKQYTNLQSSLPQWNGRIKPLPVKQTEWLKRQAKITGAAISDIVKAILVDAIDLAIEEDADLACAGKSTNTSHWSNRPLPANLQPRRIGSRQTPKTLLALEGPGHGSASAGTSSVRLALPCSKEPSSMDATTTGQQASSPASTSMPQ